MLGYYIKISRRIDQFGSCVLLLKNFKVDLDQLSLPRKFDFDIIPYARYDLDLNLDHPLASIIMWPSFVLTIYWAGSFTPRLRMVRETWPQSPGLLNDSLVALGILCLQTRRHNQTVISTQWIMRNNMEIKKNEALGRPMLTKKVDMSVFVRTLVLKRSSRKSLGNQHQRTIRT